MQVICIKKIAFYVVSVLIVIIIFFINIFIIKNSVPSNITEFYQDFLTAFSTGTYADIDPYIHYEVPEHKSLNESYFLNIENYKIQSWSKINDKLWEVTTFVQLTGDSVGEECYHFIGNFDGTLKVMIGPYNIPEELSQGGDLSIYIPSDALPPDVIVFPLS